MGEKGLLPDDRVISEHSFTTDRTPKLAYQSVVFWSTSPTDRESSQNVNWIHSADYMECKSKSNSFVYFDPNKLFLPAVKFWFDGEIASKLSHIGDFKQIKIGKKSPTVNE